MQNPFRKSELTLTCLFLVILFAVPLTQTGLELARGERVQFTDVFRMKPTARNLRQYEEVLEEKSWFQQTLRPEVQAWMFSLLHDTGAKAMLGRDGWLFYRPDVRFLIEPNRRETDSPSSRWATPGNRQTQRDSVVQAIVRYRDQLRERGIQLLAMPVPGKPSIYPDRVTRRSADHPEAVQSPTRELLDQLNRQGVATVDLFTAFANRRQQAAGREASLYLAQDTHWTPAGARLAAETVATRLRELGWAPAATQEYQARKIRVQRRGDVIELMQFPGAERAFVPEAVECDQVFDPVLGPLMPSNSDRPGAYKTPGNPAPLLVLGDSFCRVYQYLEPQSLGQVEAGGGASPPGGTGTRKPLPGSAGFISQLALRLQAPVDAIVSDGGASMDVRRKLSVNPEILEGKRVVIWEFVERDIALGRQGWEDVALPPRLQP
jgi:hypothetical protein